MTDEQYKKLSVFLNKKDYIMGLRLSQDGIKSELWVAPEQPDICLWFFDDKFRAFSRNMRLAKQIEKGMHSEV